MSKSKSKGKSKSTRSLGKAKGEPERTARVRYMEPPKWKAGNPFFAVRVPSDVLSAFKKHAKGKDSTAGEMVRAYMSRVTGVVIGGDDE